MVGLGVLPMWWMKGGMMDGSDDVNVDGDGVALTDRSPEKGWTSYRIGLTVLAERMHAIFLSTPKQSNLNKTSIRIKFKKVFLWTTNS